MHIPNWKVAHLSHVNSLTFVWGAKEAIQSVSVVTRSVWAQEVASRWGVGKDPRWSEMAGQLTQPVGPYGA